MGSTSSPSRAAALAYPLLLVGAVALADGLLDRGVSPAAVVIAVFAALAAIATGLERLIPHERAWFPSRREVGQDGLSIALLAVVQLVAQHAGEVLAAVLALVLTRASEPAAAWPLAAQIAAALVLADLGKYWLHRLAHTRAWLWRFHAEHHAPTRMYALNGVRLHPVNALWNLGLDVAVPLALGLGERAIVLAAALRTAVAVLQHANLALGPGLFDWIFSTPVLHQWHHSTELVEANANYGSTVILWDLVFGTRRLPRGHAPAALGLADPAPRPTRLWTQVAWPWCAPRCARSLTGT